MLLLDVRSQAQLVCAGLLEMTPAFLLIHLKMAVGVSLLPQPPAVQKCLHLHPRLVYVDQGTEGHLLMAVSVAMVCWLWHPHVQ